MKIFAYLIFILTGKWALTREYLYNIDRIEYVSLIKFHEVTI